MCRLCVSWPWGRSIMAHAIDVLMSAVPTMIWLHFCDSGVVFWFKLIFHWVWSLRGGYLAVFVFFQKMWIFRFYIFSKYLWSIYHMIHKYIYIDQRFIFSFRLCVLLYYYLRTIILCVILSRHLYGTSHSLSQQGVWVSSGHPLTLKYCPSGHLKMHVRNFL